MEEKVNEQCFDENREEIGEEGSKEKESWKSRKRREKVSGKSRKDQNRREKEVGAQRSLLGSTVFKILMFFLMVISAVTMLVSALVCYIDIDLGFYSDGSKEAAMREAVEGYSQMYAENVREYLEQGHPEIAMAYLESTNAQVQLLLAKNQYSTKESDIIWQSGEVGKNWISEDVYLQFTKLIFLNGSPIRNQEDYIFRVSYNPEFPVKDGVSQNYLLLTKLYEFRFAAIGICAGAALLCVICFVFLMCSAGHKNGKEGIVPSVFTNMHFDVFTFLFLSVMWVLARIIIEVSYSGRALLELAGFAVCFVIVGTLAVLYLMEFSVRLKLGKWWQNTMIYVVIRGLWRGLKFLCKGLWKLFCGAPLVLTTLIAFLGICILEFIGILLFAEAEVAVLWMMEKAVLLPVVLYIALTCRKLLTASEAMAEGENYVVDTSHMFGAMKEHGENLNRLSQGIAKAVAERMKSEHLKTELITNVSHDLKTPLTSIINYADLICEEKSENPRIAEYSEVLLRQSKRLKKLLEDLLEASKATTGNLEVKLEECEVGVLLSQAVGEYQQRMEEKGLELIINQPEYPIQIMADGRHLWRVFDNLLNNICKYAQEHSRVYLSVEQQEKNVRIIFRNMSKYALNLSAEELEERFVRGDRSRHMEGNGLGLSIAKSLTELQNGQMHIVVDGDLFKVILEFEVL